MRNERCFRKPWYYLHCQTLLTFILRISQNSVPSRASILDLGRGSPEYALLGSAGLCLSEGCDEGAVRRSGLRVLLVTVSLVVTWTLSVRLSSTPLFVRCVPDAALLWEVPDVEGWGDCVLLESCLSFLLLSCCADGARGCPLPVSVAVFRSARDETLVLDEDDMAVTFGLVGRQKKERVCSAPEAL